MRSFGFDAFVLLCRSLCLEVLKDRISVLTVDITLRHQREGHTMVETAELLDLLIAARLLVSELIAREAEDDESLVFVFLIQCLQTIVLRRETAFRSGINDEEHLTFVVCEIYFFASVIEDFEIINGCHICIIFVLFIQFFVFFYQFVKRRDHLHQFLGLSVRHLHRATHLLRNALGLLV